MRVLIAAPYIYKQEWPEFTRNRTGFGIMVNDIFESLSEDVDVYLLTNAITNGHDKVQKHSWGSVFAGAKLKDWEKGIKSFFGYRQGIKSRIRYFYYALNTGSIRNSIKNLNPDIVHIHGIGVQTRPYIEVCEEENIPYIVTLHGLIGLDDTVKAPLWDKQIEKEFLIKADNKGIPVTVISSGMKSRIEIFYLNHKAKNISVVCNGTHIPFYEELINLTEIDLRKLYQLTEEKIIVVIGSICDRKNQKQIVRAIEKVKTPFRLFLCGADNSHGEVQSLINQFGLNDKIRILGFLPKEKIEQLLEQADLNIVASKDEGYGLSILEAYKHGVPTVAFADIEAVANLYDEQAMIKVNNRIDEELAKGIELGLSRQWDREHIKDLAKFFSLGEQICKFRSENRHKLNSDGYMSIAKICDFLAYQRLHGYKVISYVGNISENKNQIELVNQMTKLKNDKVIALLAGREADNGHVRNTIKNRDLCDNVILTGFCSEMDNIWDNIDVNVFLSKNDGFGLSVIEGYMRGIPSIMSTSLDAYNDVVGEGMYGINDIDKLKSIIYEIDKENSFNRIIDDSKRFSLVYMKEKYIGIYKQWSKCY